MLPYFTRIKRYVIKPTCENFSSFRYFFYEKTAKMHLAFLYSFYYNGRSFRPAIGLEFWCCQNVGSNPGLAGRGACVLEQDT